MAHVVIYSANRPTTPVGSRFQTSSANTVDTVDSPLLGTLKCLDMVSAIIAKHRYSNKKGKC